MLQKIHERVHGVIAWVLIVLIAVTFTLWGINYYLESRSTSDVQAEVNGEKISKVDFSNTYQRLKRQAERRIDVGELTATQEQVLKRRALKQLIFTRVVLQGAQSAGYLVTREQAEQALMQIPQFQEDGQFSAEKFQQALSAASYTPTIFLTKIQEGLVINQQRFSFAGTEFVLPEEINQFIGLAKQTRDMSYLIIPEKKFESTVQISSKELHQYYEKNKAQYKIPEKISIEYVAASMKKVMSGIHISTREIQEYYQDNIDAYTHPAQWRWAHILIRVAPEAKKSEVAAAHKKASDIAYSLHHGKAFAATARRTSNDILSAAKGGMMPWVPELGVDPQILTVLQELKEGQISNPIKTKYGYEIIQRTGYQPPKQIPFHEVKQSIEEILKTDKAQQIFAQISDDMTNLSYQNPSSLDEVAKELELPIKTTSCFTRKGLAQGVASNKAIIQAAFSDEVLHDKNNSQLISLNDDLLVVLRVKKHRRPSFMSFDAVKPILENQILKEKASMKAREYGQQLLSEFRKNPKQVLGRLKWISQNNVRRDDSNLNLSILSALFKMSPDVEKRPGFQGVILENGDYAVIKLSKVEPGSIDSLDQEEQKMFKDEMEAAMGIIDYNLYVKGLVHQAKIIEHSK